MNDCFMIEITANEARRLVRRGIVCSIRINNDSNRIRVFIVIGSEAGHVLNTSYPTIESAQRAIDELNWTGPVVID
ncbi:hypothetical protein [Methylotuvimicrobium sp.]|jgi:hypothetical protein|uniref:hypothetical protein n=2 Tax=Methylotuvimicrobium sp. TaxID=2822413 RepID=UPI003D65201C